MYPSRRGTVVSALSTLHLLESYACHDGLYCIVVIASRHIDGTGSSGQCSTSTVGIHLHGHALRVPLASSHHHESVVYLIDHSTKECNVHASFSDDGCDDGRTQFTCITRGGCRNRIAYCRIFRDSVVLVHLDPLPKLVAAVLAYLVIDDNQYAAFHPS